MSDTENTPTEPQESTTRLASLEDGPISTQVTDKTQLKYLQSIVLSYWPKRRKDYFPGPQPVSLERESLFKLKRFPYMACVKSDGMRFMMLCTVVDESNKCYMIDRAFRFYEVDQCFDKVIYSNTLFDGELVRVTKKDSETTWTYVIHDCVSYNGDDVSQKNFLERYSCVKTVVNSFWDFVDKDDVFPIEVKTFVEFENLDKLVEMKKNGDITHKTDGLIFTPIKFGIGTNAQYTLFKWKPSHTFDLKIREEEDKYVAMVNKKDNLVDFASVDKDSEDGKTFGDKLKSLEDPKYENNSIVECSYNINKKSFNPILIRTDKTHPNGLFTVEKTLINVEENITENELLNLKLKIRN